MGVSKLRQVMQQVLPAKMRALQGMCIVMDASAVLYSFLNPRNTALGGELATLSASLTKLFGTLNSNGCSGVVVVDGGVEDTKLATLESRLRNKLKAMQKEKSIARPAMAINVLIATAKAANWEVLVSEKEADAAMLAVIAEKRGACHVMTSDSDFFLCDVEGVILADRLGSSAKQAPVMPHPLQALSKEYGSASQPVLLVAASIVGCDATKHNPLLASLHQALRVHGVHFGKAVETVRRHAPTTSVARHNGKEQDDQAILTAAVDIIEEMCSRGSTLCPYQRMLVDGVESLAGTCGYVSSRDPVQEHPTSLLPLLLTSTTCDQAISSIDCGIQSMSCRPEDLSQPSIWLASLHLRNLIHRLAINASMRVEPTRTEALRRNCRLDVATHTDLTPSPHPTPATMAVLAAPLTQDEVVAAAEAARSRKSRGHGPATGQEGGGWSSTGEDEGDGHGDSDGSDGAGEGQPHGGQSSSSTGTSDERRQRHSPFSSIHQAWEASSQHSSSASEEELGHEDKGEEKQAARHAGKRARTEAGEYAARSNLVQRQVEEGKEEDGLLITLAVAMCAGAYSRWTGEIVADVSHIVHHVLRLPTPMWRGVGCTLVWLCASVLGPTNHNYSLMLRASRALVFCMCARLDGVAVHDAIARTRKMAASDPTCTQPQPPSMGAVHEGQAGQQQQRLSTTHAFSAFYTGFGQVTLLLHLLGLGTRYTASFSAKDVVVNATHVAELTALQPAPLPAQMLTRHRHVYDSLVALIAACRQ